MHISVLKKEVLKYLAPQPNKNFIDCTLGNGGHSLAILKANGPNGRVLGIDWDEKIIHRFKKFLPSSFQERLILVNDNFVHLKKIVKEKNFENVTGILLDLGMSSWHLEESNRGFSFQKDEPLNMKYYIMRFRRPSETHDEITAEEIVNEWSEKEIKEILTEYGEERFAKRITQEIIKQRKDRPIKTTFQLVEIIKKATPAWYHRQRIHPATKTFQALRIAVNDELENLKKVLPQAIEILKPGGRLVVISFHSLEDRIVKKFLKQRALAKQIQIITKKPIGPRPEEIKSNPRSRSAKLRAIIKL